MKANPYKAQSHKVSHNAQASSAKRAEPQGEVAELMEGAVTDPLEQLLQNAKAPQNKVVRASAPAQRGATAGLRGKVRTGNVKAAKAGAKGDASKSLKQLALKDPKAAAKRLHELLKQGKTEQAATMVAELLGGNSAESTAGQSLLKALGKVAPGALAKYSSTYILPFLDKLAGKCAGYTMGMSRFMSALQGMSGLVQIAQFFKTVGSWLIDNYRAAHKTHAYSGHLDAMAQLQAQLAKSGQSGPVAKQQAQQIIERLSQQYAQKLTTRLQRRHGAGVDLNTTGKKHVVQTDINDHKHMLQMYKKGLQNALKQHNAMGSGTHGKLFGKLVEAMARKASGSQSPSVSDYREVFKRLCDEQIAAQSGLKS